MKPRRELIWIRFSVATFDRKGDQYWKRSLVDDLGRLIDAVRLDGRGLNRVIKVLYDYLDAEQFEDLLDLFGHIDWL